MRKLEEFPQVPMIARTILVFILDGGKSGPQDEDRPDQGNHADDQIGLDPPERFCPQVRLVNSLNLAGSHFLWRQLDARKNKDRANEDPGDRAQRIECLREIEPSFRTLRIPQLRDEGIGSRLQKGKATCDHEESQQKKLIA